MFWWSYIILEFGGGLGRMFKSKLTYKNIIAVFCLIGSLVWLAAFSFPDNRLHLIFCDVGQGDAILITQGFNQILIDGGPNDKVLACLKNNLSFFDKKLEIVALTHPDADHLTGIIPVMEKYKVDYFLIGPEGNNSAIFAALVKKLESFCKVTPCPSTSLRVNARGRLINVYTGEKIKLGDMILEVLWPEKEWVTEQLETGIETSRFVLGAKTTNPKLNDFSLVFLLEYREKKALLMGDADSRVQDEIMAGNTLTSVEILKFPHHGSKTGMREDFLEKIQPKEAVISVGKNSFGHPTTEALEMLKNEGVTVRRTDLEGEIKYTF